MLKITKLGDPAFAFIYYFPICFFINGNMGVKVLWIAALTEWINGVLKWYKNSLFQQFIFRNKLRHLLVL